MLSADEILGIEALPVLEVSVPEWRSAPDRPAPVVGVRMLEGTEYSALGEATKAIREDQSDPLFLGKIAALVLCDEKGQRLFKDADAPKLAKKGLGGLQRIMNAAFAHNGLTKEAQEDLGNSSTSAPTS